MEMLYRASIWMEAAVKVLVVVLFIFMLGTVLLEVLARNLPFRVRGLDEVARYSQIWLIFLVVSVAARHGELIGTDMAVNRLPERLGRLVRIVARIITLLFLAALTYYAFELVQHNFQTGRRSGNLRIPFHWVYLPIMLGNALMFFFLLVDLVIGRSPSTAGDDAPPSGGSKAN